MIYIVPTSINSVTSHPDYPATNPLAAFLAGVVPLVKPVTQLGQTAATDDVVFSVSVNAFDSRELLTVLEMAASEGRNIMLVVTGFGLASTGWSLIPTTLAKVSLEEVGREVASTARKTTTKDSQFEPTATNLKKAAGEGKGFRPAVKMVQPSSGTGASRVRKEVDPEPANDEEACDGVTE